MTCPIPTYIPMCRRCLVVTYCVPYRAGSVSMVCNSIRCNTRLTVLSKLSQSRRSSKTWPANNRSNISSLIMAVYASVWVLKLRAQPSLVGREAPPPHHPPIIIDGRNPHITTTPLQGPVHPYPVCKPDPRSA
jgi:hypothetical protein